MQQRGQRRASTERRTPSWAALGAVFAVLLAGLVAIPGCLNPRPEEDPSALELDTPPDSEPSATAPAPGESPVRETCEDNGLLAGCEPPSSDNGASLPPASSEPPTPDAGVPSAADAGRVDAGTAGPQGSSVAE